MSSKQKARKIARLQESVQEQEAIKNRRNERMTPVYLEVRRVTVALLSTILLLVVGVIVNNHLQEIAQKLHHS